MKKTIRSCISCIRPFPALDGIWIVQPNGRVEEVTDTIRAAEVMRSHPKHVLKKPSSPPPSEEGARRSIVIVPPDEELQRGKIYFLIPASSSPAKTRPSRLSARKKKMAVRHSGSRLTVADLLSSDRYLSEILSEKASTQRDRRRGRGGVWRPRLESILETPSEG